MDDPVSAVREGLRDGLTREPEAAPQRYGPRGIAVAPAGIGASTLSPTGDLGPSGPSLGASMRQSSSLKRFMSTNPAALKPVSQQIREGITAGDWAGTDKVINECCSRTDVSVVNSLQPLLRNVLVPLQDASCSPSPYRILDFMLSNVDTATIQTVVVDQAVFKNVVGLLQS
eukprot:gene4296-4581_t